jgi:RNA-binding protein YlmH
LVRSNFQALQIKEELVESEDEEEEEEEENEEAEEDDGIAKDYREMTLRVSTPRLDVVMAKVLNKGRG